MLKKIKSTEYEEEELRVEDEEFIEDFLLFFHQWRWFDLEAVSMLMKICVILMN